MFTERTSVGLDVHTRSVTAAAIDGDTGELFGQRLVPASEVVIDWVRALPGPVAVTYEAGPTGFGLARAMATAGIRCEVAAPSKLSRPAGVASRRGVSDLLCKKSVLEELGSTAGAKGLNLALAEVRVLARELERAVATADLQPWPTTDGGPSAESFMGQHFSYWMVTMLHTLPNATPFDIRHQEGSWQRSGNLSPVDLPGRGVHQLVGSVRRSPRLPARLRSHVRVAS